VNPLSLMSTNSKLIAIVIVLGLAFSGGWYVASNIWETKYLKKEAEISEAKAEAYKEAIAEYKSLKEIIEVIDKQRYSEYVEYKKSIDSIHADLLSGTKRLSVLVQRRPSGEAGVPNPQGPGVGDGAEEANLDPRVAAGLISLTGRGDQAIIQLNACQDILQALESGDKASAEAIFRRLETTPVGQPSPTPEN
jgi:prophage endopeptidase